MTRETPLSDLEDGSLSASRLAEECVHALIIHAGELGADAGDAAALAALDLIACLAVFGRVPLKVVLDTITAAAPVRVKFSGWRALRLSWLSPGSLPNTSVRGWQTVFASMYNVRPSGHQTVKSISDRCGRRPASHRRWSQRATRSRKGGRAPPPSH